MLVTSAEAAKYTAALLTASAAQLLQLNGRLRAIK